MADSDTKGQKRLIDSLMQHPKQIMISMVVVCVLAVGVILVAGFFFKNKIAVSDPNVVAEVGGEKIYLAEYKERLFAAEGGLGFPKEPVIYEATNGIKESVLNDLRDLKILDKEVARRNIKVTDEELTAEAKKVFKDYDTRDTDSQKAYRDYVRLKVEKDKLVNSQASWKEGYAIYCYFNRADMSDFSSKPDASGKKKTDKQYALNYCTGMKQRLESGQSSQKDEMARVKADPQIGENAWKPYYMSFGAEIDKDFLSGTPRTVYNLESQVSDLANEQNQYYILTLQELAESQGSKNDVSLGGKVSTQKIPQTESPKSPADKDALYALVYIKDGHSGDIKSLDSWLQSEYQTYNAKTYPERIKL